MKRSKLSEAQVAFILCQAEEERTAIGKVCHKARDLGADVLQVAFEIGRDGSL